MWHPYDPTVVDFGPDISNDDKNTHTHADTHNDAEKIIAPKCDAHLTPLDSLVCCWLIPSLLAILSG